MAIGRAIVRQPEVIAPHAIGRATLVEHLAGETILHLRTEAGAVLKVKLAGDSDIRIGDAVPVRLDLAGAWLFGADGLARGQV